MGKWTEILKRNKKIEWDLIGYFAERPVIINHEGEVVNKFPVLAREEILKPRRRPPQVLALRTKLDLVRS